VRVSELDAEVGADDLVRKPVDRAGGDFASLVENAELAGDAAGKGKLLFDQQNGQALFLVQAQDNVANFMNDVGLDAFGRLVEDQDLWFEHQGAADRELLLLASGEIATSTPQHLLQHRE